MAKKKTTQRTEVHLTEKAIRDFADIRDYSIQEFGKRVANKYVATFESALSRIKQHPDLLVSYNDFHAWMKFYRVEKHLLVCDVNGTTIIVLTVVGASQDIPSRLLELEPTLKREIDLLHRRLQQNQQRK